MKRPNASPESAFRTEMSEPCRFPNPVQWVPQSGITRARNRNRQRSARLEHTSKLADRGEIVIQVFQNFAAYDAVEHSFVERQLRGVADEPRIPATALLSG